ncbi:ABC transporter ATP-binding protein [Streptomyces sp. NPDC039016]|uniref:ABC transporter ATP-binding protein n=1 Tax=unclassified Streptomyces TaxID=2593676 RepID=UPI000C27A4DD|nr:ABC transporter ATP-binding protein [Streptomyces sp. CB02959]PJN37558.1 2-aminoethylphosphonate ABC transport system ATP-binding subunit PhnT [Streptomyces sp. CB02959]
MPTPSAAAAAPSAAPRPASGIRFDRVTVAHGRRGEHTVLDSLDLTVEPGEVMALLGPSGSGKTTALRAVAGFVRPVSGRVLIGGRDVTALPPYKRGIGMVVQQYALFPHMKVAENVAFGLKAHKAPRAEIPGRVAEALELVGMAAYADRHPRELSGGQQQRVAIARALAIRPGVLLLDEPLSALDAQLRSGMLTELARLHRELPDVSILYVTHDQVEALTLADRIAVLESARLRECGTPQALYRSPRTEFTASFVGTANLLPVTVRHDGGVEFAGRPLAVPTGDATPGATATLCVRPHLLGLGAAPDPHGNTLRGTVTEVQWRGATHRLYLTVDGHRVLADLRELRETPPLGTELTLHFAPEDAVLIPAGIQPGTGTGIPAGAPAGTLAAAADGGPRHA